MEYNDALYYDDTEDDDIENSTDDGSSEAIEEQTELVDDPNDLGDIPENDGEVSSEVIEEQMKSVADPNDLGDIPENDGEVSSEVIEEQMESVDDSNYLGDIPENDDEASSEAIEEQMESVADPNDLGDIPENDDEASSEAIEEQMESVDDPNDLGDVPENEYEVSSGTKIEQQKIADSNVNEDILTYDCDDEYEDEYFNKKDWFEAQLVSVEDRINLANRNLDVLEWENENRIGDCVMKPKDANSEIAKALTEAGVEGIKYTNGNVDFSPVSKYDFEIENMEELYKKLGDSISIGKLDSRKDLSREVRSKWQSLVKDEIVSRVNSDSNFAEQFEKKTGIKAPFGEFTKKMLNDGLSQNKLSLHETSDCSSVQFVPRTIHETYKHCGGTAEMMEKLLSGDHKA